jgi:hypothetical protein
MIPVLKVMRCFKEGKIVVTGNHTKAIQVEIEGDRKILDVYDFSFEDPSDDNIFVKLSKARDLGSKLKNIDQTLVVRHKGKDVMKFGKEANPKISLLVTMSRNVEISDLLELRRLSKTMDPKE